MIADEGWSLVRGDRWLGVIVGEGGSLGRDDRW